MNEAPSRAPASDADAEARQRRLELTQRAYRDFFALCFSFCDPNLKVTEADLPFIIRELRHRLNP